MRRRDFLAAAAGVAAAAMPGCSRFWRRFDDEITGGEGRCGPGFAHPRDALRAPKEKLLYTIGLYVGTPLKQPDFLATVDVDPESPTYSQVVHRLPMPYAGDELHHFGWNACSSCHGDSRRSRRYLVVPGLRSSRIYIVDTAAAKAPTLHKVIEPEEIKSKTNLSAPHTVHCIPGGQIMISMLGDAEGRGPGGFLLLDPDFKVAGRWERKSEGMMYNYDYWFQPRHNIMVSSEFAAPNTYYPGFKLEDVQAGKYGQRLHFWDWEKRELIKTHQLGESGMIPLEVRFHHDPESTHGFVGAALSSTMWHWHKKDGVWSVEKVIGVDPVEVKSWPFPVPGLITDLLVSMDDRFLYFSNWLHGDVRQYDISDPSHPVLTGRVWCGGVIGNKATVAGHELAGGPQMLQLSLDGQRLYVTNSILSSWDNQFYPDIAKQGSYILQIDCDGKNGGMKINDRFYVDFGREPGGPARAHEMRYPGGDCTSDIFI